MKWNSKLYDNAQKFVSEYGTSLIDFIPLKKNQSILDLGCGTGDLTNEINTRLSVNIKGVDASKEMIDEARSKYPNISFDICNATELIFENEFDIVFSNAVFHWIPNQNDLHKSIYNALKKDGILISEFGADKNIYNISSAFANAIIKYNDIYSSPFYFPTVDNHAKILKSNNFIIDKIYDYDRPTILPNGNLGLRQWVCQFFSDALNKYSESKQEEIFSSMESQLHDTMFDGKNWIADYRRLRTIAHIK